MALLYPSDSIPITSFTLSVRYKPNNYIRLTLPTSSIANYNFFIAMAINISL
jgi:hypothetical protein